MARWAKYLKCAATIGAALCVVDEAGATVVRVSQRPNDIAGWNFPSGKIRGGSDAPVSVSADGRYVAFITDSNNAEEDNARGGNTVAILRDMQSGTVTLVTPSSDGQPLNGGIDSVCVSADGHYVVFSSWANNVVPNDTNNAGDVFVRDVWLGTTSRVSLTDAGNQSNGDSWTTARCISADGRYVVFQSEANNLTGAADTNDAEDVFVRDLQARRTYLISKSTAGVPGNGSSMEPNITPNGRYVAFFSMSDNLVAGLSGMMPRAYIRDNDPTKNTTTLVAMGAMPSCSADGRYVTYITLPGTLAVWAQVAVHDMVAGGTDKVVSVAPNGVTLGDKDSIPAWISESGRYVAFTSKARNLVANDTNNETDVFMRDLQTNATTRLSVGVDGVQGARASGYAYPSGDGRYVAFISACEDLVPLDVNEQPDIFLAGPTYTAGFKAADAATAAGIWSGKKVATSDEKALYNVVKTGASADKVDILDVLRITRMAAGLDPQ